MGGIRDVLADVQASVLIKMSQDPTVSLRDSKSSKYGVPGPAR